MKNSNVKNVRSVLGPFVYNPETDEFEPVLQSVKDEGTVITVSDPDPIWE